MTLDLPSFWRFRAPPLLGVVGWLCGCLFVGVDGRGVLDDDGCGEVCGGDVGWGVLAFLSFLCCPADLTTVNSCSVGNFAYPLFARLICD